MAALADRRERSRFQIEDEVLVVVEKRMTAARTLGGVLTCSDLNLSVVVRIVYRSGWRRDEKCSGAGTTE